MDTIPKLRFLSEQFRGHVEELDGDVFTIGRAPDADIQIADGTISSHHCTLEADEDGNFWVVDDGYSTNGTRISGDVVTNHRLRDGDILQLGTIECLYEANLESSHSASTQTQIAIAADALETNTTGNVAPGWLQRSDDARTGKWISSIIVVLVIVAISLSAVMAWKLLVHVV